MQLSRSILTILIGFVFVMAPSGASAGPVGCCTIEGTCSDNFGAQLCEMSGGAFIEGGTCAGPAGPCESPPPPTPEIACCQRVGECNDNAVSMICVLGGGTYVAGGACVGTTCETPPTPTATPDTGCCDLAEGCSSDSNFMNCELSQGTYLPGGVCNEETGNCENAPTPTPTGGPNGSSCTSSTECTSMFCVDGVCCDSACEGEIDRCDVAGSEGECTALNPTPAASNRALAAMALLLCGIAAFGLRRKTRQAKRPSY